MLEVGSNSIADAYHSIHLRKENIVVITLREESNAEKSPAEQKNAELKNANLVQNSHSFIPHFSGILDHSQSFIPHFLNCRLHLFQCIFLPFKEI